MTTKEMTLEGIAANPSSLERGWTPPALKSLRRPLNSIQRCKFLPGAFRPPIQQKTQRPFATDTKLPTSG